MASLFIDLLESGKLELLGGLLTRFALVLIPFLLIVNYVKDWRIILLCVMIFCGVIFGAIYQAFPDEPKTETPSDLVIGDETVVDFYDILREVGIASSKAKNIKKIEDWANGPRFTFETHGTTATVYCNANYEIETIRFGTDLDLYKKGYEPWKIDNFIVSADMRIELITYAEKIVRSQLKYPDAAGFPLMDWSVSRQFNKYVIKSHVKAQNALGLRPDVPFTVGVLVDGDKAKVIYFELDGKVSVNEWDKYPLPERKKLASAQSGSGTIHVTDSQASEYRQVVELDGQEHIWYMIPAGKYKAECNSSSCMVYLEKNDISDGRITRIATYSWNKGEYVVITVSGNQHLSCDAGADVILTKVE